MVGWLLRISLLKHPMLHPGRDRIDDLDHDPGVLRLDHVIVSLAAEAQVVANSIVAGTPSPIAISSAIVLALSRQSQNKTAALGRAGGHQAKQRSLIALPHRDHLDAVCPACRLRAHRRFAGNTAAQKLATIFESDPATGIFPRVR
jgi:hypothetical protein